MVGKDIKMDAVDPLTWDACWWLPCGVTWDAVSEELWLLKLQ